MDTLFREFAQKSRDTAAMVADYRDKNIELGLKPLKMFCSIDKHERLEVYQKLVTELETKTLNSCMFSRVR